VSAKVHPLGAMVVAARWMSVVLVLLASCSSPRGIVVPPETADSSIGDAATLPDVTTGPYPDAPPINDSGLCVPVPSACPAVVPSYATDVAPIFTARCNGCHMSGPDLPWPLTSYQEVNEWAGNIAYDLVYCTMPPVDAGIAITPSEVNTILTWIVCDSPDN
jgi:hypothetical protein